MLPAAAPASLRARSLSPASYIKHIVVIVQENRSFENMFAGWPGADAPMYGYLHTGQRVKLHQMTYADDCYAIRGFSSCDLGHLWQQGILSWNNGKMDGFDRIGLGTLGNGPRAGTYPYAYLDAKETAPYRAMAKQYVLADQMFPTEFGTSFTAHQDLIAGTTQIDSSHSLVNIPLPGPPWGCEAPPQETTSLVDDNRVITNNGPFPCFDQYQTIADRLDAAHVSWKYYAPSTGVFAGSVWSAFSAIKNVYYGPDWKKNVITPETIALTDPGKGKLPSVSWIIPDLQWSDHPVTTSNLGPDWVGDLVDAIGKSKDWKSTAIVVLWDDWGGWYDNAPPPQLDYAGLGIRVPCIIISPYARKGYVSHTQYEYGSILKFIEQTFNLSSLGATDVRAASLVDSFDFTQKPRAFVPIATRHPASFFLHQPPSLAPPDND
ncbi:MAG TPA: alkaline phosphatase family protein [Candidatus Baltobacteraceae bacterium]|nr:alkaline phosphatase family protein [Candidatus Baltobacteraceae bacterium]